MRLFTFSKLLLLLCILAFNVEAKMMSRTQIIMGTFITISLESKHQKHIEEGFKIFKAVDSSLSSFKKNSDITQLNLHQKATLNNYTYEALFLSKQYYKNTNGYFDVSIGSITKDLYAFGEKERIPTSNELKNALVNLDSLDFNQSHASIEKGIKIDLGGMGKGFGVDKLVMYFKENNITQGIIRASGDIRCLDRCSIQVQDPYSDGIIASFKTLQYDIGISTSGNYNRYVESVKNNHLINPKRQESQTTFVSITLVSPMKSSDLDAYATAVSVMPKFEAYKFLDSLELGYIVLQSDGEMVYSHSLFQFVEDLAIAL